MCIRDRLTVEQGKTLNQELTHKVKEVVENTSDTALRARLSSMTAEERAAFAEKVAAMSAELDAASVKVDVEDADGDAADAE